MVNIKICKKRRKNQSGSVNNHRKTGEKHIKHGGNREKRGDKQILEGKSLNMGRTLPNGEIFTTIR